MRYVTLEHRTGEIKLVLPTNSAKSKIAFAAFTLLQIAFPSLTIVYASQKD